MFGSPAACLIFALLALGSDPFQRTWTDTQGRTLEGSFVRLDGDQVTIKMESGDVTVPLSRLSLSDRKYARDRAAADAAETTPAAEVAEDDAPAKPLKSPSEGNKNVPNPERVWTDRFGQKLKGRFVRIHEGSVVIQGAKTVPIPFASLSTEDQEWVRTYKEARGEGDEVPEIVAQVPNGNPGGPFPGAPFPGGIPAPPNNQFNGPANIQQAMEENRRKMEEARAQMEQRQAENRARMEEQQRQREAEQMQREAEDRARREAAEQAMQRQREEMQNRASQPAAPTFNNPPPTPAMPNIPPPNFPRFEEMYVCESCNHDITKQEALGSSCPYCRVHWDHKPPELPPPTSSASSWGNVNVSGRAIKGLFGLAVLIIGGIAAAIRWLTGSGSSSSDTYASTNYYPPSPTPTPTENPFANKNPFN